MALHWFGCALLLACLWGSHLPAAEEEFAQAITATTVFRSGEGGYDTYRIPSLIVARDGTLLAFAEGRKTSASDTGDIDLLLKRSGDQGKTWSSPLIVWDDGENVCGNPCPVLVRRTGAICLLMTWNHGADKESEIIAQTSTDTRRVYLAHSGDNGLTWTRPTEITPQAKRSNWTWYATGPGAGIEIEQGPLAGRLVIPCDHIEAITKDYYSHVLFSDDQGRSWTLGGSTPKPGVNECEVVELEGGRLMLNMRNYVKTAKCRQIAESEDGGLSWVDQRHDQALIEPICQASIRRLSWPGPEKRSIILFSNPASLKREKLTLRASFDEGRSWPLSQLIDDRPSAYSCLAALPDGTVGLLYETGEKNYHETIAFRRFEVERLFARPR